MEATNRPIVITGASGYVGSHLAVALTKAGAAVRCLVRPQAQAADVQFLQASGAAVTKADLVDSEAMPAVLSGASVVVHLIGSIAPRRGQKFADLHAGQVKQLIERCRENGVSKVVMVTALGTAGDAASQYHQSKWQAERCLQESGLDYVILRPSLLVGRQVGKRDSKLVKRLTDLIKNKKMVPLVGGGRNKIQPLFIADLMAALQTVIFSREFDGQVLDLAGPEVLSMKDFCLELMKLLNIHKPIVDLPPVVAQFIAGCCELLQPVPLLSCDQVRLSLNDNTGSPDVLKTIIKRNAQPLSVALQSYQAGALDVNCKVVV